MRIVKCQLQCQCLVLFSYCKSVIPALIECNAKLLYKHLSKKDADFVHEACQQYILVPEENESSGNTDSVSIQSGSVRMSYKAIGQVSIINLFIEFWKNKNFTYIKIEPVRKEKHDKIMSYVDCAD